MRFRSLLVLALAAGLPLAAQAPRVGFGLDLVVPTGALSSTVYPDPAYDQTIKETFDTTVGARLMLSWPLDRRSALRLEVGGQTFTGKGRPSDPYFSNYNIEQTLFQVGGQALIFLGAGNAQRHQGSYLLGGLSLDVERYRAGYGDLLWDEADYSENATRLGATVGFGHSFRGAGRARYGFEVAVHRTLGDHEVGHGDLPASDFLKVGFVMTF